MVKQQTAPAQSTDAAVEDELDRLTGDADRPVARQVSRVVSERSAEAVRGGFAPALRSVPNLGEGLWRVLPLGAAPARSDDEGICCEAERENRAAAPDQAGLSPCPGMERQKSSGDGAGGRLCL